MIEMNVKIVEDILAVFSDQKIPMKQSGKSPVILDENFHSFLIFAIFLQLK